MPPKPSKPATASSSSSSSSPLDKLREIHNSLPYYYYVYLILVVFYGLLYAFGVLKYLLLWYCFCLFFSPHAGWEASSFLLKRSCLHFKHYPRSFSLTPVGILLSRMLLIYPLETIFYYIDEIFFSSYKKTQIKEPLLILGQPRSGTTKFESVLEGDEDFVCLKLYEVRWPYLCVQYTIDAVCRLDAQFLGGAIAKFVRDHKLLHAFDETGSERAKMRRLRWDLSDEDDTVFLFHFFVHFQLMGAFPDPDLVYFVHHFDQLSTRERRRMLEFHKKAVQKVMHRRGQGKRYFAKWVLSWCGVVQEAMQVYPDLKMLVIVREPKEQLRSWFKLQGLLAKDLTGFDPLSRSPEVLAMIKKINVEFYQNEINYLRQLSSDRSIIIKFTDFYKDIQKSTRDIYRFLGKEIRPGSKFEKFLLEQTQQQLTHKATETDNRYISDAEIDREFPDLLTELFEKEVKEEAKKGVKAEDVKAEEAKAEEAKEEEIKETKAEIEAEESSSEDINAKEEDQETKKEK